ncbi:hypothetical protein AVEN_58265-1 [Araneus ventricosus]|uniref:Uncharacterized protein n=1 Tax=Araneus ventricosus TaxID=182803 RepID=A0A4Y2T7L1_ARAVE|nr:hypothetical protein AVEN_240319-1 [Araneus ventricosus]GBN96614.1 hypothetical protein AVEN_58265-1 [Araneus ventricosus]
MRFLSPILRLISSGNIKPWVLSPEKKRDPQGNWVRGQLWMVIFQPTRSRLFKLERSPHKEAIIHSGALQRDSRRTDFEKGSLQTKAVFAASPASLVIRHFCGCCMRQFGLYKLRFVVRGRCFSFHSVLFFFITVVVRRACSDMLLS